MDIKQEILHHMAKAFFASAWADQCEESENGMSLSGCEIMDVMPDEIDPAAIHAAETLYMDMEQLNGPDLEDLFNTLCEATTGQGDRPHTPEYFGHYAAMQAMGHGVGLSNAFGSDAGDFVKVPYVEFGAYSLEKDYFK